jgi:hypothetical protein
MPLQIRRGTAAEKDAMIVPLAQGELLWTTNEKKLYIGDGATLPNALTPVSGFSNEDVQDAAAPLFTHSGHSGISFTYNDSGNQIIATVNLPDYQGVIQADGFQGSLFADDSSLLVDAIEGKINLDGTVKGNIIPSSSQVFDIGSPIARFKDLYLSGTSLYLGNAVLTASGSSVNLPFGSTIGGSPIGIDVGEALQGNLVGSVFGDDSTMLVDGVDNTLFGNTINTAGISLSNNVVSTINSPLVIQPDLNVFTQVPVNFNILAASTTSSILDAAYQAIDIRAHRGSFDAPTDIQVGDILGTISLTGFSPTTGSEIGCLIGAQCDPTGITTPTWIPTKFFILNQPDNVSSLNTPFLTFDSFGRLAVNQENAQATLDVNGDAIIRGGLRADLTGSLFSDASTMIFDGTDGKLMTANINLIGETGNTPVDAVTVDSWLEVTVNGVTKYIPLYD